jgi:hypothetical protein
MNIKYLVQLPDDVNKKITKNNILCDRRDDNDDTPFLHKGFTIFGTLL